MAFGVLTIGFSEGSSRLSTTVPPRAPRGPGVPPFFAGEENRLPALAVARLVDSAAPCPAANPLVLHGPTGAGKTHLLRGLVEAWQRAAPPRRAIHVTGADFATELADSLERRAAPAFRARYREVDLLALDEPAPLGSRVPAQFELLHTIDAVLERGGQVVIVAGQRPSTAGGLLPALVGRLAGGLVLPLVWPETATRRALLAERAAARGLRATDDLLDTLARRHTGSVTVMLGSLARAHAAADLSARAGGAALADAVAGASAAAPAGPDLPAIARLTAREFRVTLAALRGPSRRREIVLARDVAMLLARRHAGCSLQAAGRFFGRRDHTTVLHGCRRVEQLLRDDPCVAASVGRLEQRLLHAGACG